MANWCIEEDVLKIDSSTGNLPKLLVGGSRWMTGCFGGVVFAVAGFSLVAQIVEPGHGIEALLFTVFFFLIGLLSLISASYRPSTHYLPVIRLDRGAETLTWEVIGTDRSLHERVTLALRDFSHIYAARIANQDVKIDGDEIATPHNATTNIHLFLVKRDGASFWLDGYQETQQATVLSHLEMLHEFLGLPVKTNISSEWEREGRCTYEKTIETDEDIISTCASITSTPEGLVIALKPKTSFRLALSKLIVALLFGAGPLALFGIILSQLLGAPAMLMLLGILSLPIIAVFSLAIGVVFRQVEVVVHDTVQCRLRYPLPLVGRLLGQTVDVPLNAIQSVLLHRAQAGQFWLVLQLKREFPLGLWTKFLFYLGSPNRNELCPGEESSGSMLSLWEVHPHDYGIGPMFSDLHKIEGMLKEQLSLSSPC